MTQPEQTDLNRFDAFTIGAAIPTEDIAIGGFLPGVQIKTKNHYVTFLFNDDGSFGDISIVEAES